MEIPFLTEGHYSVLSAEISTGIVLKTDGKRYNGEGIVFWIAESLNEAEDFIDLMISKNPDKEYVLYNSERQSVYTQTIDGKEIRPL